MNGTFSRIREIANSLPLPEKWEFALIAWFVIALGVGIIAAGRIKRQPLLRITLALLLSFIGIISLYSLDTHRMIEREAAKPIVILLPLYTCADVQNYWPGGRFLEGASIQSLRTVRDDPDCFWSSTASIALLLLSWAAFAVGLGIGIGPLRLRIFQ